MFDYEEDLRQADAAVTSVLDRGAVRTRRPTQVRAPGVRGFGEGDARAPLVGAYDPEEPEETLLRRRDEMYSRAGAALNGAPGVPDLVYVEPAGMSRLVLASTTSWLTRLLSVAKRTPEQEWHDFLAGTHPHLHHAKPFRLVPSSPRCRLCAAPFRAPGSTTSSGSASPRRRTPTASGASPDSSSTRRSAPR